ncbi:unnamed protein product [Oncorhynchus mykiss]|uniref:Uncharacterized protein n=1 Tax=Oncorhynchus mykiss TaxID=8022 RepID=A0A060WBP3_ONCMY|nr:unnamed protein product [Oncorhynchus mykiss]
MYFYQNRPFMLWTSIFSQSFPCGTLSPTEHPLLGAVSCFSLFLHVSLFFCTASAVRTGDLGGYATSDEFTRAVIANLAI